MSENNNKKASELYCGRKGVPSGLWKRWYTTIDEKACTICMENNGKIYAMAEVPSPQPPLHPHCRCVIDTIEAIMAGTATIDGVMGADWFLKYHGMLPRNYLTKEQAKSLGWIKRKGNLAEVAPGMQLSGGLYLNDDGKLPVSSARTWYEADINYIEGYRGNARVLYSNDGLLFVTYDHYKTFSEIV